MKIWGKNEKREIKLHKNEEKGLKSASFWVINSKKIIEMHNIYPCTPK